MLQGNITPYEKCWHAEASYEEWFRNGHVDHVTQTKTKRLAQGRMLDWMIPHNFVSRDPNQVCRRSLAG